MLILNSITFKDDATGKVIEVNVDGSDTSSQNFTPDEYFCSSLYAGLILGGGFTALLDYTQKGKNKK